jgi:hypothetical protein
MNLRFASAPMSLRDRFFPTAPIGAPEAAEASAARALSARRGRLPIAPPQSAGKSVAGVLRPLLRDAGIGFHELKRRWSELAGESFARAEPEKLSAGVLTLRAPGALAPFLQQQAPLLVERLSVAGAKIKAVRIEQRSAAAPRPNLRAARAAPLSSGEEAALAQALDPTLDPGLRSALLRLGRAVRRS